MKNQKKRFHQFVKLEKGPVNTAVIDFLKGELFQVENPAIEKFQRGETETIGELVESLEAEGLIFQFPADTWIPSPEPESTYLEELPVELELDAGVDFGLVQEKFRPYELSRVVVYGPLPAGLKLHAQIIESAEKDFNICMEMSHANGDFPKMNEKSYAFNMKFNTCWGKKIAIAANGDIKPCIFSDMVLGNLERDTVTEILAKLRPCWELTKDKVEKCKECELRYTCFDCRVIASRHSGDLHGANPNCFYNPASGNWTE